MLSRHLASRIEKTPEILETKTNLNGIVKTFVCRRLAGGAGHVVVLHVLPSEMRVAGAILPAGTLTFGHFWEDRPYNVYHWLTQAGTTVGFYFNIADATSVTHERVDWRDLTLDVLALPGSSPQVLDRDELPRDLEPRLREHIDAAVTKLLQDLQALLAQLDAQADELWQQLFGTVRGTGSHP